MDAVLKRLSALEMDNPKSDIMNQTFDSLPGRAQDAFGVSSTTLKSKVNSGLKKIVAKQITLK
jgi:hypothetical protein